jgi:integrase
MLLQAIYGFRISELLSLRRSDVKSNGFIRVPGTKASNSRIIYFPDILDMQFFKDLGPTEKIFNITYRQYYLILKRNGVEKKIHQYSKKMAVTHMFRHFRLVENELLAPGEIAVQKNFSGHKTDRGINFYRNNKGLLQQINEASTNNP